jgi:hypothetical protein
LFEINKKLSNEKGAYLIKPAEQNEYAKPKLLEQVRTELRVNHYSKRTEEAYIGRTKRYILFHNNRHSIAHSSVHPVRYFV